MAEERDLTADTVDIIAAAATPASTVASARHFADPVVDAYSVAAASVDGQVRAPDPRVERALPQSEAIAAASGLMTYPAPPGSRWWRDIAGPAVVGSGPEAAALVPGSRGAWTVRPGERVMRRTRGRELPSGPATVLAGRLPPDASWFRLLWWSLRRRRGSMGLLIVLSLIGGLAALILPLATGALFSYAIPEGDVATAAGILAAFAVASIGAAVVFLARNVLVILMRDHSDTALSTAAMAHAMRLPVSFFRTTAFGDTLNRLLSVVQARTSVDDGVPSLIITSVFGIVNLLVLLVINPLLALLAALAVAIVLGVSLWAQVRARASLSRVLEERSRSDASLMAMAESIVPIRVSGSESRALAQWAALQAHAVDAFAVRLRRLNAPQPLMSAGPLVVNIVLVVAVIVVGTSALTLRQFMPAYAAVVQLTVAMGMLTANLVRLWELGPVYSRLTTITTAPVERPGERRPSGRLEGAIAINELVFGYETDEPPLFDGLSLSIEPGEFVALVGPSGGGKSTILRLLLGFEEPWSGVVTYDGKDLAQLDVQAVRRQLGTVLQAATPYGRTIRGAVCGPLQLSDDDLWSVLAEAGLADEVRGLPDGPDTAIGERGGTISGGQRQRLMIARALAGQPRILLLDEATSALDNVTQDVVMCSILDKPITRVAVAHRLTTVQRADRVIVVADGGIIESGAPSQLLERGGHFARLAARQQF